jgi:hypothetical protein
LRSPAFSGDASAVELPIERADVQAIMTALFDANRKLDDVLSYLYGEDDGEEEEEDPA